MIQRNGPLEEGQNFWRPTTAPKKTWWQKYWPIVIFGPIVGLTGILTLACIANTVVPMDPKQGDIDPGARPVASATVKAQSHADPTPTDFKLTVKVLSKKCYGSAGCLLTFTVEATCEVCRNLPPNASYRVIYTINGPEDGPATNSFIINGASYAADAEESMQTKSTSIVPTATVTEVLKS